MTSTKTFRVFDCSGDTVYVLPGRVEDTDGNLVDMTCSGPYAITPSSGSTVVKVAYSDPDGGEPSSISVWREGDPNNPSPVNRNGPPVPFTVPHVVGDHHYQASLNWATGGAPKVIVRQDDFATRPVEREE